MIDDLSPSLLSRLKGVRKTGANRWIARCPGHDDRRPSLAIRRARDGRFLIHCFAGCSVSEILASVGMNFSDLYPSQSNCKPWCKTQRQFFQDPSDALLCIALEARIAAIAASDVAEGHPISAKDANRTAIAAGRINDALNITGINT